MESSNEIKNNFSLNLKKRSKSSFDIFVLFYIFMNLFTFLCIIYFSNDYWTSHSLLFHLLFYLCAFLSIFIFFSVRNKPGYIDIIEFTKEDEGKKEISQELQESDNVLLKIEPIDDKSNYSIIDNAKIDTKKIDIHNHQAIKNKINSFRKKCEICNVIIVIIFLFSL